MTVTGAYLVSVFLILLISGCIINFLEHHYIIQVAGIASFLLFYVYRAYALYQEKLQTGQNEIFGLTLIAFTGISAILFSMVLGFWLFPGLRKNRRK